MSDDVVKDIAKYVYKKCKEQFIYWKQALKIDLASGGKDRDIIKENYDLWLNKCKYVIRLIRTL